MKIILISTLAVACCFNLATAQEKAPITAEKAQNSSAKSETQSEKFPKNWSNDTRAVYDLLVAQMLHASTDYAGSADSLIKFAKTQKDEQLYAKALKSLMQLERYADAVELTADWAKLSKININKFYVLALVMNNDIDLALNEIAKVVERKQDKELDNVLASYEQLLLSNWYAEPILDIFSRLYEDYPDSEVTSNAYAQLLRWRGDTDKAVGIVQKRRFNNPRDLDLVTQQSDIYRYAVRLDDAEKIWQDFLSDYPKEDTFRLAYAQYLYDRYDFSRVEVELEKIQDQELKYIVSILKLMTQVQQQKFTEAEKTFKNELENSDAAMRARMTFAEHLVQQKNYDLATRYLKPLLEQDKDSDTGFAIPAALLKGKILYLSAEKDDLSTGDAWFTEMRDRFQIASEAVLDAQMNALENAGYMKTAYERVNAFLKDNPNHEVMRYTRSLLAVELGLETVAIEALRTLYAQSPDHVDVQNSLGYTLLDDDKTQEEGEILIKKALFSRPGSAAYIDSLGWAKYRRKKFEEALPFFRYSYANFLDGEVIGHYILTLHHVGKPELAKRLYQLEKRYPPNAKRIDEFVKPILKELQADSLAKAADKKN